MTILSPKKTYIDCIGLYLQKRTMNMEIRIMYVIMSTGCRTNGLLNQWVVGPMGCRTNGLSDHREVVSIKQKLPSNASIFTAEATAVDLALDIIEEIDDDNFIIFSDYHLTIG